MVVGDFTIGQLSRPFKKRRPQLPQENTNPLHIIAAITHPITLLEIFVVATLTSRASRDTEATTNRLLQNRMDSSDAENYPQESLPLFISFWIVSLFFTCCALICFCFAFAKYRTNRGREVLFRPGNNGERLPRTTQVEVNETITEVDRRKTLTLCFQRNQVTMVRIRVWHFRMECRPAY
jgi:hypothetical protein